MSELLKIHTNGQWELVKAEPVDPKVLAAHKARREAWLREKHGMRPAAEGDNKVQESPKVGDVPMWHGAKRIDSSQKAKEVDTERAAEERKEMRAKLKDKPIIKRPDAQNPMTAKQLGEHKAKFATHHEDIEDFKKPNVPKKI